MNQRVPPSIRLPRARRVAIDDPDAHPPGTALHKLTSRLRHRHLQQQALADFLPHSLRKHIRIGEFRDGELTLLFSNAAWLTRARYQQQILLESLQQHPDYRGLQRLRLIIVTG